MGSFARRIWNALGRRLRHARVLATACRESREVLGSASSGTVLVLCYGNIYRSPFVARRLASSLNPSRWTVRSAGFHPTVNRACEPGYVKLASTYGVDLSDHRSRRVTRKDIQESDVVIIMDRKNWDQLHELAPDDAHGKVVWVGCGLGDGRPEIEDPYSRSDHQIRRIVQRLDAAAGALQRILNAA